MNHHLVCRTFAFFMAGAVLAAAGALGAGCAASSVPNEESEEDLTVDLEELAVGVAQEATSTPVCESSVAGKYCWNDMIANGSPSILYHCPGGAGAPAQVASHCPAGCHVSPQGVNDYCNAGNSACQTNANCDNCVFYARCQKPNLPRGLFSFNDKKNIINTYQPRAGAVAVIDTGNSVGHVAYVESVNGSTLQISEGNWPYGSCGTRSGTMQSLKIVGFFD